ncbi:hypothetical protein GCM10027271_56640 [Saccharopolyspora gloriosae]|uniref:Uncharacterized protein n=1 Tax=Saccharopolyspora gloriosae TaxID=455344 RepID=A0A840N703_9PSEU|nr:hypothetical protein [Saccharopolyspora gloriosae]MBB5067750.1 hypothetical protein [Saccharopolyspora gloriosae]
MDLIVISFAGGAVVAAVIFWPLLRRARRRAHADTPPTGKHALRTPQQQAKPTGDTARPAAAEPDARPAEAAPERADIPHQETAADRSAEPLPDRPETDGALGVSVATLPTALFEEHYEAKFRRTRDRIERLRNQLHEQN